MTLGKSLATSHLAFIPRPVQFLLISKLLLLQMCLHVKIVCYLLHPGCVCPTTSVGMYCLVSFPGSNYEGDVGENSSLDMLS